MPLVVCHTCGKEFSARPGRIASGRGKFCSRECSATSRRNTDIVSCQWCGKETLRKSARQKYCSRACAAASAHAVHFSKPQQTRPCRTCGRPFLPRTATDAHCDTRCRMADRQDSGQGYGMFEDPWANGSIPPDRYGKDLYRMPDAGLGF